LQAELCYSYLSVLFITQGGWEANKGRSYGEVCVMVCRCCRGLGYVDDKSIERLSVLFPRLSSVELRLCSVTDDGLSTFCRHNKSRDGGLSRLILDHPGDISDRAVMTLADHSPCLAHLTLSHCRRVTNVALRSVRRHCMRSLFVTHTRPQTSPSVITSVPINLRYIGFQLKLQLVAGLQ